MGEAAGRLLACDWGTTNLRAWVLDAAGQVVRAQDFPLGVSRLAPGEVEARFHDTVRPAMAARALPALLCGMIGSTLGWVVAPYLECPAGLEELRRAMVEVGGSGPRVRIVPGLQGPGLEGAPEVMRGEETQVFGWLSLAPERLRGRHLICHPGTHAKWVVIEDGRIVRFLTAMTGELFDVLRKHSVLRSDAPARSQAAFDLGLQAAGDGGALSARLFSVRTRVVASDMAPEAAPSYLSGLLIGSEVASLPPLLGLEPGSPVSLVGDPGLTLWYERALASAGYRVQVHDGDEAVLAGLRALHEETAR